jgi:hypothetical protein
MYNQEVLMRVRVVLTYDFSTAERRRLHDYYGLPGLADRQFLKDLLWDLGHPANTNGDWVSLLDADADGAEGEGPGALLSDYDDDELEDDADAWS